MPVVPVPPALVCVVVVVPSNQVTVHGPLPVNAAEIVADCPLQIVVLPLTTDVGRALTVPDLLQVLLQPLLTTVRVKVNVPAVMF